MRFRKIDRRGLFRLLGLGTIAAALPAAAAPPKSYGEVVEGVLEIDKALLGVSSHPEAFKDSEVHAFMRCMTDYARESKKEISVFVLGPWNEFEVKGHIKLMRHITGRCG